MVPVRKLAAAIEFHPLATMAGILARCAGVRFSAIWLAMLAALAVNWSQPASAESTASYKAQLDAIAIEMRQLWGELERFQPKKRYCYPPHEPMKVPDQAQMIQLSARVDALAARYQGVKQGLMTFLGNNHRLYAELMVNGVDPGDRRWWRRYDRFRDDMVRERNRKQAMLASAPEVHCAPAIQRPQTPSAAPTFQPPATPQRPAYEPLNWPPLPPHFCSLDEYWDFIIQQINPLYLRAAENAEKAAHFRSLVAQAINAYVQKDQPVPAALRELDTQAAADVREQNRLSQEADAIRRRAKAIPVIDCSQPQQSKQDLRTGPQQGVEQPRQDMRTGQAPAVQPPQTPGLTEEDQQRIALQQREIEEFEEALLELQSLIKAGKCSQAWDLVDDLDEWLDAIDQPPARVRPAGLGPPVRIPGRLIDQWDDRIDDLLKGCPRPGRPKLGISDILRLHNQERATFGYPPLRWSFRLSDSAQNYANQMAQTGQLTHASREGRGIERENINQAFHGSSPQGLMANWLNERRNFVPGLFPNVSRTGNWADAGHYSQIIWPETTAVGCGVARGVQWDFFVCRYSPGGNKDGQSVGLAPPAN